MLLSKYEDLEIEIEEKKKKNSGKKGINKHIKTDTWHFQPIWNAKITLYKTTYHFKRIFMWLKNINLVAEEESLIPK